jgi:hypothetical protein
MWVGSRDGRHFDANFIIIQRSPLVLFYEAAGGEAARARNTEYGKGLVEMLRRLGELDAVIHEIRVETSVTKTLPVDERRIVLKRHRFPVSLHAFDEAMALDLKRDISTAARLPGSRLGSATGGSSRNLEIQLDELAVSAEELARYLSAPRSD